MEDLATFTCAACGEQIETDVDPSAGRRQRYIEDCWVCCRPNMLDIRYQGDDTIMILATCEE